MIPSDLFAEKRHFLTFRLGDRIRGLDTRRIVRVAEIHHISPLPSDLRCNLGLVIHRGVVAGLMDLELLEAQSTRDKARSDGRAPSADDRPWTQMPFFCVFARFPRGVAGFPITELLDLQTVAPNLPEEEAMLSFEIVDLDALEIFV